jgi:hypothetical protein
MGTQMLLQIAGSVGLVGLVPLVRQIVKELSVIPFLTRFPTVTALVISAGFYAIFNALPDSWQPFMGFVSLVAGLSSVYNDFAASKKAETKVNEMVVEKETGQPIEGVEPVMPANGQDVTPLNP